MKKDIYDYKILIVDDNTELRNMLGGFLKKEGYKEIYISSYSLSDDLRNKPHGIRVIEIKDIAELCRSLFRENR